uniref:Protein yippee-like n=1 Tax=Guillardia theta TaxID=55529 RepID=A0A7S4KLT5_GUITH|mmetsp:Transcript_26976/g.88205  ORF Transcript_26976/g.88205 Transcript_26976/m.88205 type:complete len:128 (+) Transcript_26976:347-730(+)
MGKIFKIYLCGDRIYSCSGCRTHLAKHDQIVSKAFQGRHGRAFLFSNVVNITLGPKEDRILITGLHTVADVYCNCCQAVLGWKYVEAFEESQKYKEGKCIIEKAKMAMEPNMLPENIHRSNDPCYGF